MGRVRVPALRRLFRLVYSCGCRILPASGSWEGCGFRPSAAFSGSGGFSGCPMRRPRAWVFCLFLSRVPHPSRFWFMGRVRVSALRPLFRPVCSRGCRILRASGSWEGCGFRPSAAFSAWFTLAGAASFPILPHGKGAGFGPSFPPFAPLPHRFTLSSRATHPASTTRGICIFPAANSPPRFRHSHRRRSSEI